MIAAAATIMLSVFASFGFSGERIVSEIGIGLAIAVIVDAFVVRLTLVPALMNLLGRRNWIYPRWADRFTPGLRSRAQQRRRTTRLTWCWPQHPAWCTTARHSAPSGGTCVALLLASNECAGYRLTHRPPRRGRRPGRRDLVTVR